MPGWTRRVATLLLTMVVVLQAISASLPERVQAARAPEAPPTEAPAPEAIPETELERTEPEPTEVVELRTATSSTFDNHDGTFTARITPHPVHYQAEGGTEWQPIDTDFASQLPGLKAATSRAPVRVEVGAASATTQFVTVEGDGVEVGLGLPADRLAEASGLLSLDGPLADVGGLGSDVDLRVLARAFGAKLYLVLANEPATPTFDLVLSTPGLTAALGEDGSIEIVDSRDRLAARIAPPLAVESSPDAERGGGMLTDLVSYSLEPDGAGRYRLRISVDPAWLADAVYPVYVDPSITIGTGSDAYGDAFVSSEYPSMNFADYQRPDSPYYHEHWLGMDPTNSAQVNYVYLKFDTSPVAGQTVTLARLKVRPYHQYYNAPTATTTWVDRVNGSWTESGLTWNNKPGSTNVTSAGTVEGTDANFTVTSTVQSWASGTLTNYGFKLHENGNNGTYWKRLIASEQGSGYSLPTLYVEYHRPSATVASPTGSAWTKSRSLDWTFSDSSGHAQSHYEVQVSTSSTFGTLIANSGQVASSATVWSIPTSVALANGTTYYWRVRVKDGTSWSLWTSAAAFRWDAADATYTPPAGDIVGGAVTAANPSYYDLGNGTMTVKIRGTDTHSGIKLTYLRLYNATDELRVVHDWSVGGTHCNEFNASTLADATACSETSNSGGAREVTFTIAGLSADATFSVRWHFVDYAGNAVGYDEPNAAPNDGLTGKSLIFDNTPPTGSITNPAAGATVGGTVTVSGTASDANFHQYQLHYGAGSTPTTWTSITTSSSQVTNGTLGTWNTSGLSAGTYTLRLQVFDKARISSGFTTVTRTVTVDPTVPTAVISSPAANAVVAGSVTVTGTASASSNYSGYTLSRGSGCSPSSWTTITTSSSQVTNGTLGTWSTAGLEGQHSLRLVVSKTTGVTNTAQVCVNVDNTAPSAIIGAPSAGEFVNHTVDIVGQASDPNFTGYDLHVGTGANPTTWTAIGSNPRTTAVEDGLLGTWDTSGLSGTYTIRLRVYDPTHTASGYAEATRTVTVSDAVNLFAPAVLHATGAELRWSAYDGAAPSTGYEVHRSTTAGFSPGPATLIARLGEPARTSWRDTSAKPGVAFSYRIVANGLASNEVRVTLPAAGQATVSLQPTPADGKASVIYSGAGGCANYGAQPSSLIGSTASGAYRALFGFDLRSIPSGAVISSATFSYTYQPTSASVGTVNLHQALAAWAEGSAAGSCDGSGASWRDADGAVPWDAVGADYLSAATASVNPASRSAGGTDAFAITSLVQRWIDSGSPNHGLLVRLASEPAANGNTFTIATDDYGLDPAKRPKLVITYAEPGAAQPPHAALNQPAAGATVRGTVTLGATASDDSGVAGVDFLVDGVVVGSDASAPFALSWASTSVANGQRAISVRATDNAGNVRTSPVTTVTVDNVAAPSVSLTAPTGGTVSGTVTMSASASGTGLERVEFLFDDYLIGSDTSSPYSISWNTLDPLLSAYDGSHTLVARAYGSGGQMTQSAPVTVTVANRTGSRLATLALAGDSEMPSFVFEDAGAGARTEAADPASTRTLPSEPVNSQPGAAYRATTCTPSGSLTDSQMAPTRVKVVVTNASASQWSNGAYDLWYRWFTPAGQVIFEGRLAQGFQTTNAGASRTITGDVYAPALCGADQMAQLRLRFDLLDPATGAWFAEGGNPPLDHPVAVGKELQVAKGLSDKLGLERYYPYWGSDAGAGMGHLVNLANGNSILRWTPFSAPGRGLSTVVDLTYNSLEDRSESPVGNNWSLAVSSLSRLGGRLDIHPNKADQLANNAAKWIAFTDGDGTTHRFEGKVAADGTIYWEEPPGVHLYLRDYALARGLSGTLATERKWALTRPDGVTFYYNVDGYPTRVDDRNGNALTFSLEAISPADDPGGNKFRVTTVTDAGGRAFTISYYDRAAAPKPQVRGKVASITDHTGSELAFEYYLDGNLRRLIQRGGTHADGSPLADRVFVFTYTTPQGAGPAISGGGAARYAADERTNQSTRLYSVFDPRTPEDSGNPERHETVFSYFGPGSGELRWKLSGVTDRGGQQTTFGYDLANRVTTVTAPLSRVTRYAYDTDGKVTSITDPLNRATTVSWTTDFHVSAVDEPGNGRTEFAYNANGYLTDRKVKTGVDDGGNPVFAHTRLTYQNLEADAQPAGFDEAGKWRSGRTIPHLSQLSVKIDPNGMLNGTPTGTHDWAFAYDGRGNLLTMTDPENNASTFTYAAGDGTLQTATDANGSKTEYADYDANGFPQLIREGIVGTAAPLRVTRLDYDEDGRLVALQDPNHFDPAAGPLARENATFFEYDAFGRLGRQSAPKSTTLEPGQLIWSAALYDANDNLVRQVGPHYGSGYTGLGAATEVSYDRMDRQTLVVGPDTSVDPAGERTAFAYDAAGRLTSVTAPKGVLNGTSPDDFATFYAYDPLDRILRVTRHEVAGTTITRSLVSHACYDANDDLVRVTLPNANLASVDCAAAAPSHTWRYEYDAAHRLTAAIDPEAHRSETAYDASGNVIRRVDALGRTTFTEYEQRNLPVEVRQPFIVAGMAGDPRSVVTRLEYDPVGNRSRLITPRAVDADGGAGLYAEYATTYEYDALNRLVRTLLPTSSTFPAQQYVHAAYDPNGNLTWSSLPTTDAAPPATAAGQAEAGTLVSFWDPGWVATSKSPDTTPRVHFDYTAEGWQAMRVPERASGELNLAEQMFWSYFADGMLRERSDRGGQRTTYTYDANNNLTAAVDAAGLTAATRTPIEVLTDYTGLDQVLKTRSREVPAAGQPIGSVPYTFTKFSYDRNGNVEVRVDNGTQAYGSTTESGGRRQEYVYDTADWMTTQFDRGPDSTSGAWSDDQRIRNTFLATGWEASRIVERATSSSAWAPKQTTTWDYFANGKLAKLTVRDATDTLVEQHDVRYTDPDGIYVNGHRTVDEQLLKGPNASAPCYTAACVQTYEYDPRDRLVAYDDGQPAGTDTSYLLDVVGNIASQTDLTGGVAATTTYAYAGNQLQSVTAPGGAVQRYFYDPTGNLACVTIEAGDAGDCGLASGGSASANVLARYAYDYLDRLVSYRSFTTDGTTSTADDVADYEHDALDRVNNQTETHDGVPQRHTTFTYQGLSRLTAAEVHYAGSAPTGSQQLTTKSYSYDAWGNRIALSDDVTPLGNGNPTGTDPAAVPYTYAYDVHGSVSLLLTQAGGATASYGYRPYGQADDALTNGDFDPADPDENTAREQNPLNAFRYSGRRLDTGSGSIDMGARRYGPDTSRFLQRDYLTAALGDLSLALDPLTQGRYSFAGGNPVSFVEWDGHVFLINGSGGGTPMPTTRDEEDPERESPPPPPLLIDDYGPVDLVRDAAGGFVTAGIAIARMGSAAGRELAGPDEAARSRAGQLLRRFGSDRVLRDVGRFFRPIAQHASKGVLGIGIASSLVGNVLEEGNTPGMVIAESATELVFGAVGGVATIGACALLAAGLGCLAAGVTIGVVSGIGGSVVGEAIGQVVGPAIDDTFEVVGDVIGGIGDWFGDLGG